MRAPGPPHEWPPSHLPWHICVAPFMQQLGSLRMASCTRLVSHTFCAWPMMGEFSALHPQESTHHAGTVRRVPKNRQTLPTLPIEVAIEGAHFWACVRGRSGGSLSHTSHCFMVAMATLAPSPGVNSWPPARHMAATLRREGSLGRLVSSTALKCSREAAGCPAAMQ